MTDVGIWFQSASDPLFCFDRTWKSGNLCSLKEWSISNDHFTAKTFFVDDSIFTTVGWIAMTFCAEIHEPLRINPTNRSFHSANKICQDLAESTKILTAWIILTFIITHLFFKQSIRLAFMFFSVMDWGVKFSEGVEPKCRHQQLNRSAPGINPNKLSKKLEEQRHLN